MFCVTPSPLNLEGLLFHVVCLYSGKEEIVSLGQIQVVKGPVFKHLDALICQVDSEVKLLGHLSRGQGSNDVVYKGLFLLKVINI